MKNSLNHARWVKIQRDLSDAEIGNLKLIPKPISSIEIIESIVLVLKNSKNSVNKHLQIDKFVENIQMVIDIITIKRILSNMTLNALEASLEGETVTIGCKIMNNNIRFWVKNRTYIPQSIQSQIFTRSFSTKGTDRGLGTYSMKILGQNYLKGKVNFTTNEIQGTTFFIDLPLKYKID